MELLNKGEHGAIGRLRQNAAERGGVVAVQPSTDQSVSGKTVNALVCVLAVRSFAGVGGVAPVAVSDR